jgi:hypothetical protein
MSRFATRLKIIQRLCQLSLTCVVLGMIGIFLVPDSPTLVKSVLGAGLLGAIVSSSWLAFLRCPQCGQRFCGSQAGGDVAPYPDIFTSKCRFCGHEAAS